MQSKLKHGKPCITLTPFIIFARSLRCCMISPSCPLIILPLLSLSFSFALCVSAPFSLFYLWGQAWRYGSPVVVSMNWALSTYSIYIYIHNLLVSGSQPLFSCSYGTNMGGLQWQFSLFFKSCNWLEIRYANPQSGANRSTLIEWLGGCILIETCITWPWEKLNKWNKENAN